MSITRTILAAVALSLASNSSQAGECGKLATAEEKISCLEQTVEALETKLATERLRAALFEKETRRQLLREVERLVDERIGKALEPRMWWHESGGH